MHLQNPVGDEVPSECRSCSRLRLLVASSGNQEVLRIADEIEVSGEQCVDVLLSPSLEHERILGSQTGPRPA